MYDREHDEDWYAFKNIPDNPIRLDFTGCKSYWQFHVILKEAFGFPEYYGKNFDALWDCLDGLFREERTVEIYGLHSLPAAFEEDIRILLKVFEDVHEESPNVTFVVIS